MEISYQSNTITPCVWAKPQPVLFTEMCYLQPKTESTTNYNVGLQNICAAANHEFAEVSRAAVQFTYCDTQRRRMAQLGEAGEIGVFEWLFQPVDVIWLQFSCDKQCSLQIPGPARITGHAPSLVCVNHDLHRVSDCLTYSRHHLNVALNVFVSHADFYSPETMFPQLEYLFHSLGRSVKFARRAVGWYTIGVPPQEAK